MLAMNYGCGSAVDPRDLGGERPVVYVGVGGGLEALQLAYFRRRPGGVIAVDPVPEMRAAAARNLREAAGRNPWFQPEFVHLVDGTADALPVAEGSADVVAQNCLFNIFVEEDFGAALAEAFRVLAPGGRFVTSDPIAAAPLPESLRRNDTLRARCISGCQTYGAYLAGLEKAGFRRVVVRGRFPYRLLTRSEYPELDREVLLETLEAVAFKPGTPAEPFTVHSGRHAVYRGPEAACTHRGFTFVRGSPVPVSEETAAELERRPDFLITGATSSARTAGCC